MRNQDQGAQVVEIALFSILARRLDSRGLGREYSNLRRDDAPKILKASEQGIDGRLEALWHELGGEDQGRHGRKHAYGRSNHGIAKHVEDLVADAKRNIHSRDDEEIKARGYDLNEGGEPEERPEAPAAHSCLT